VIVDADEVMSDLVGLVLVRDPRDVLGGVAELEA
jgi:hypothetical protein